MLFGVTFEDNSGRKYRFIFLSNYIASHLKIGSKIEKENIEELIEHAESDAKSIRGIDLEDYCKKPEKKTKKDRLKPRFILFRIFDKRKEEEELKKEHFDFDALCRINKETIEKMVASEYDSFRIIQSESLPSAHHLDIYLDLIRKDEKKKKETEDPEQSEQR